jgi:hypothetical protein
LVRCLLHLQAKANQQQQLDKNQQQTGEIQETLQKITATLTEYLTPLTSNDLDRRCDYYWGEMPRCLLVNEMAEVVEKLLKQRPRQP